MGKEPKDDDDKYMDIDIFEGEGEYEAPKRKKEPKPAKQPRRPIDDIFGLSTLPDEIAQRWGKPMNRWQGDAEEKQLTQKQYERKIQRQSEREWREIQKIHEKKYGS